MEFQISFNPLDRGNLYLIPPEPEEEEEDSEAFQSPRSGKFVSNDLRTDEIIQEMVVRFQSPRSGKFVSNLASCSTLALS